MSGEWERPAELGQDRPHSARMYDYFLGGLTNYRADREAAAQAQEAAPYVPVAARLNRSFMHRVTRYVVEELGIRQFLDVGTGIPTEPNLHQVAQQFRPDARIVYADNDPIVLTYARALLTGTSEGAIDYVDADVRETEKILERAAETLDFDEPICLSLVALFHFVQDAERPVELTQAMLRALPSGSTLALSHGTPDFNEQLEEAAESYRGRGVSARLRTYDEVTEFFAGLELVEPGIVATHEWRPGWAGAGMAMLPGMVERAESGVWAGLGIKR